MADRAPLIDVRAAAAFVAGHAPGAANVPLEELPRRVHELPPAGAALRVTDIDLARAEAAAAFLAGRGHPVELVPWGETSPAETGPPRVRLWQPNPFLVEALGHVGRLATLPRALDVACGTGRDAAYLALQGYDVDALDVLPDAVERAEDLARRSGVRIRRVVQDLERNPSLPSGQYHLVTVFRFLQRNLFPALRGAVAPGGYVVYDTFHERNRDTGRRPLNPDHLLKTGELARAFDGFEVLVARDAAERGGRFFSSLLARRPAFPAF